MRKALLVAVFWPFAAVAQQPSAPSSALPVRPPLVGLDGTTKLEASPSPPIIDRKSSAAGNPIDKTKSIDPPPPPPAMPR